jgi:phenylalanyl-tRNA synthetase beta chain
MKISYKWLKDFVETDKSPEDLAKALTLHSFEVEGIEELGAGLDNVVVGEVVWRDKHPDADKLSVTKVKVSETETLDIVCGAPNVEVGQKVAVALVGAELPNGMKIEERKVRGALSCGMICAEDELGLGKDHAGIMVLDADLKVGTPLREALGLDDSILDIDVLPNRAHDCLCHMGVAREVAAITGKKIKELESDSLKGKDQNEFLSVEIREKELCRRYSAAVVRGVTVKESPDFIKSRLASVDLRPINNIVDITNYVMFAYGQPMHAFDAAKVKGGIIVRLAKQGEKILALDDKEYELTENDLVIADEEKPIAVAGVIGGKDASVTAETKDIIFESANFFGTNIRKTAQRLKIMTDSSHRFEREIDPNLTMPCLGEAVRLTKENAGGEIAGGIIDVYSQPRSSKVIEFAYDRIENLLGIKIPLEDTLAALRSLGMEAVSENGSIKVTIPTFRVDIEKVNDIIEEVARIYGYDKIPAQLPTVAMAQVRQSLMWQLEREAKEVCRGLGLSEVYNYSLIGQKDFEDFNLSLSESMELKNYLNEDQKFFRTSLMPRLIKNVKENLKYRDEVRLFEFGRVAFKAEGALPIEKKYLSGVISSKNIEKEKLFFVGKGIIEAFFESQGINGIKFEAVEGNASFWHKGRAARIMAGDKLLGNLGEIHPAVLEKLEVGMRVFGFELYLEELLSVRKKEGEFKGVNKLPTSEFDLAVIVDKNIEWQKIRDSVSNLNEENIIKMSPFDVYEGENIGADKKSVAFRVVCQAKDRTLGDEEIKGIMERIVAVLEKIGGEIRK